MTTEITIMNRQAIALAADSAVTIGRERVWKTANKLFSLSPYNDIAIMAYGAGDFAGIPWETIIKTFRSKIGDQKFSLVTECADALLDYLQEFEIINETEEAASIYVVFLKVIERINGNLGECKTAADFKIAIGNRIRSETEAASKLSSIDIVLDRSDFVATYGAAIKSLAKDIFNKNHITNKIYEEIISLMYAVFHSQTKSKYYTGVVVAGFGHKENFPAQKVFLIDGKHKRTLRRWEGKSSENLNDPDGTNACITPLGQGDIAFLFLEGIASRHLRWVRRSLKNILDDKSDDLIKSYVQDEDQKTVEMALQKKLNTRAVREIEKEFDNYRDKSLVQPIMKVISSLPKEEMADMAEALVEITSLRRRVDSALESVGGPIDVAVISKGDGLVWIKRKHYFDGALNSDFRDRKRIRMGE